ncbi:MAG: acyl carrier protein [Cyanobacteria bacterium P01_G01_bin.49]
MSHPKSKASQSTTQNFSDSSPTYFEVEKWLVSYLAELLEMAPNTINPALSFHEYGLDSSAAVILSGDLQDWLGRDLEATLLLDYPTIEALAQYVTQNQSNE